MKIKSKIEGMDEWLFIEELPDTHTAVAQLAEKHISIKREPVKKLLYYQLSCGGMFLMHSSMQFNKPVRILSEVDGETITSQFIFYESNDSTLKIAGKKTLHGSNRHNIRYIPSSKGRYEVVPGMEYNYFLMVLSKEYYFHLIDRHSLTHSAFVTAISEGRYSSLAAQDLTVTFEMKRIINDVCTCNKSGELKRLFTESKVLELLMLQLEQMQLNPGECSMQIKTADLEKLNHAKELLDGTYSNPPTIRELSRKINLNEFKLKQGFKAYYGATIYGYVTRLRMEAAKNMILYDHKSIGEVASAVGFKHQGHLTDAFKKYFGILPSEVKLSG